MSKHINFCFLIILVLFLSIPSKIFASTILFKDNFESGNASNWNAAIGDPGNWQVENTNGSNMYGASLNYGITAREAGNPKWEDYQVDMDMSPISGIDKNIKVRWQPKIGDFCAEFHFNGEGLHSTGGPDVNYVMENGKMHHIKLVLVKNYYFLYVDGNYLTYATNPDPSCDKGAIGLEVGSGSIYTEVWFDNIVVSTIDANTPIPTLAPTEAPSPTLVPTAVPTAIPTPAPSPTPAPPTLIPTPAQLDLHVAPLKQTSKPWASHIYDDAQNWSPKSPTISSWGCALTSGAMILNYYGINKLPDGQRLDPGTLNSWLKSQNDGYVGTGWVNWLALSRLSKAARSINKITKFDALEYTRKNTTDNNVLKSDLNNSNPDILEEPGHFIVGKGINNDTFNINDPYYDDRKTLNDNYNNTFLSLGTFSPSSTDLSYIMVTTDSDISTKIKDSSGNILGNNFVQQSLMNDDNPKQANTPIGILYLAKPDLKDYQLTLSSPTNKITNFKVYLYDESGSAKILDETASIGTTESKFEINFNKNGLSSSTVREELTIDDLINDIIHLRNLNLIQPKFVSVLEGSANEIKKDLNAKNKNKVLLNLKKLQIVIRLSSDIQITKEAKKILVSDIDSLSYNINYPSGNPWWNKILLGFKLF